MTKNAIPLVDLRGKTPLDLLRAYPERAREIVSEATNTYGLPSRLASLIALPFADKKSRAWLEEMGNPYLQEIESFADIMGVSGMYALNLSYEWGCTSGIYRTEETVSLLRVMDWPFPALGKNAVVALQKGNAGDFYNLTWPGLSGVFTGTAPGRFACAINQAPMRKHKMGFIGDWIKNRLLMSTEEGLPPSHLLRQVFEQADNYDEAKRMLTTSPIALPAIFVLSGVNQGEGCIIERLENSAQVVEIGAAQQITATNHFITSLANEGTGWRPREIDSHGRYQQSCSIHGYDLRENNFDWLRAPIINQRTRLCVIADAASHRLLAQGFEGMSTVTDIFNLPAKPYEERTVPDFLQSVSVA